MDVTSDKLSIKNLLFTKAIPNYIIPIPVNGHKVYACTDCGDKFLFESSYNDHINRKSARISYMCRHCNILRIFNNRCNLLFHIRSHAFKTATINVTDLKIEPLPIGNTQITTTTTTATALPIASTSGLTPEISRNSTSSNIFCHECTANIHVTGIAYKDRARHFMQYTNEVYACPVCLFALPNICGLKVHLRLHLRYPPFFCPECGAHLINKNVFYPYNHDCEGFKMMRATARLDCSVPDCTLFHPNDYKEHMKKYHLKKVYKCPFCVVACFNEATMIKHFKEHNAKAKPLTFYQCDICPGKYVMQSPKISDTHLKSHINSSIYPCWACGSTFKEVSHILSHFILKHYQSASVVDAVKSLLDEKDSLTNKPKRIYRVVKKCDQCNRNFTYKCKYDEIQILPNQCPYKCTSNMESRVTPVPEQNTDDHITCYMCKVKLSQDWEEIKKHYAQFHKAHKCLDAKVLVTRIDIKKYLTREDFLKYKARTNMKTIKPPPRKTKIRGVNKKHATSVSSNRLSSKTPSIITSNEKGDLYVCNMCGNNYEQKASFEDHMRTHKDPCMAYQCMECGQSFVVKPSFSKHLLLAHGITDADHYIVNKQCYNEHALRKYNRDIEIAAQPLGENQCNICRDEFDDQEDLEKHYRVHGMAFLMKTTSKNNNSL